MAGHSLGFPRIIATEENSFGSPPYSSKSRKQFGFSPVSYQRYHCCHDPSAFLTEEPIG
jgi:hypothetical protein